MFFVVIQAGVHTSSVRTLRYGWWAYALGERTTPRLSQSSKIISVDGNLASGKGALAQKLADTLGNYLTVGSSRSSMHSTSDSLRFIVMHRMAKVWVVRTAPLNWSLSDIFEASSDFEKNKTKTHMCMSRAFYCWKTSMSVYCGDRSTDNSRLVHIMSIAFIIQYFLHIFFILFFGILAYIFYL